MTPFPHRLCLSLDPLIWVESHQICIQNELKFELQLTLLSAKSVPELCLPNQPNSKNFTLTFFSGTYGVVTQTKKVNEGPVTFGSARPTLTLLSDPEPHNETANWCTELAFDLMLVRTPFLTHFSLYGWLTFTA